MTNNKCGRTEGNGKSPLEHHDINGCKQNAVMDEKISVQKFKETQNACIISKCLPPNTNDCGNFNMSTNSVLLLP